MAAVAAVPSPKPPFDDAESQRRVASLMRDLLVELARAAKDAPNGRGEVRAVFVARNGRVTCESYFQPAPRYSRE